MDRRSVPGRQKLIGIGSLAAGSALEGGLEFQTLITLGMDLAQH